MDVSDNELFNERTTHRQKKMEVSCRTKPACLRAVHRDRQRIFNQMIVVHHELFCVQFSWIECRNKKEGNEVFSNTVLIALEVACFYMTTLNS